MKIRRKNGFTLIELLVVVAIIGLLASVVLTSLNTARAKGRDSARVQSVKQLQNALELYYNDNGRYPGSNSWYDNGCQSTYTDINTILSGYITLARDPGSVCMLYTLDDGIVPSGSGINFEYYIMFPAETQGILSQDMNCFTPATYYCVGAK